MIWRLIGHWLSFLLPTFYKRIQVHGLHNIYTSDPVVIAMNHPNAFTDPIAFSYHVFPLRLHYMARGDAFKPGFAAWVLGQIGIIPIFRIQDAGKEGLKKNNAAYDYVNRLLRKNAKVIVFAEGLCVQERRLRPLKKGVARMVFGAIETIGNQNLKVIPVGVNYSKPEKFRSKVLYNVGAPISLQQYLPLYKENPARAHNEFLNDLENKMKELVIHIPDPGLDDTVHYIEKLVRSEKIAHMGIRNPSLHDEFVTSNQLVESLVIARHKQPAAVETFRNCAQEYFSELQRSNLKDWLFRPGEQKNLTWAHVALRIAALMLCLPVYVTGMATNLPPLLLTQFITGKIVKAVEFYSSFALGVSMLCFPLAYLIWFLVLLSFWNVPGALAGCLLAALCGWACLYLHPFVLRTAGIVRYLRLGEKRARLLLQRKELVEMINKF